jgi:hypothetical protein
MAIIQPWTALWRASASARGEWLMGAIRVAITMIASWFEAYLNY